MYRVHQAKYLIHVLVVAPQEYVNTYSTRRVLRSAAFGFTLTIESRIKTKGGFG